MNLIALPAFTDNCTRMRHHGRPAVVDPGGSALAMVALDAAPLVLAAILVNPRHADHAREFEVKPGVRVADNAVTPRVRPRSADADEPFTVLAAARPWKDDPRC